ncbi:MAG: hypothetical protein E7667_04160 [Ruminococcaceae bacterium]|nr:hypothetical protein [Oscillospiraceae bacterium]
MKNNIKFLLKCILVCLAACMLILSFSSCKKDEYSEMDTRVKKLVEHTIDGNSQGVREYMSDVRTDKEINDIFPQMHETMSGVKFYSVQRVDTEEQQSEGTGKVIVKYFVYTLNLEVYEVKVAEVDGLDGFVGYTVKKVLSGDSENLAPVFDQVIFLLYTLACIAFCVKMIIDCARRQIGKNKIVKALIMIGIICGGLCVFTYGSGGFNFKLFPSIFLSFSEEIGVKGLTQVRLFLPVGAVVYCILRKKYPMPERAKKKSKDASKEDPGTRPEAELLANGVKQISENDASGAEESTAEQKQNLEE